MSDIFELLQRRTAIMGVLNVTPDSFSGDGIYHRPEAAAERARLMAAEGADLIDIGGQSTRPGAQPVSLEEELNRVLPTVRALTTAAPITLSIDTSKPKVAQRALAAGVRLVNDVSGLVDRGLAEVAAEAGAGMVLVHHGPAAMSVDLMEQIIVDLRRQVEVAVRVGVPERRIIVDPGLGFGKSWRENFEIIRRLRELRAVGRPVLIGPSRKGMIGRVLGVDVGDRIEGTAALVVLALTNGANVVRVHDVREMVRVARMTDALVKPVEWSDRLSARYGPADGEEFARCRGAEVRR